MMPTYAVTIQGFGTAEFSAATPSKARAEAWRNFTECYECTFKEFLKIAKVYRVDLPPKKGYDYVRRAYGLNVKIGQRVRIKDEGKISGMEGEVLYPGESTAHVHVLLDGRSDRSIVHPNSVEIID